MGLSVLLKIALMVGQLVLLNKGLAKRIEGSNDDCCGLGEVSKTPASDQLECICVGS